MSSDRSPQSIMVVRACMCVYMHVYVHVILLHTWHPLAQGERPEFGEQRPGWQGWGSR